MHPKSARKPTIKASELGRLALCDLFLESLCPDSLSSYLAIIQATGVLSTGALLKMQPSPMAGPDGRGKLETLCQRRFSSMQRLMSSASKTIPTSTKTGSRILSSTLPHSWAWANWRSERSRKPNQGLGGWIFFCMTAIREYDTRLNLCSARSIRATSYVLWNIGISSANDIRNSNIGPYWSPRR